MRLFAPLSALLCAFPCFVAHGAPVRIVNEGTCPEPATFRSALEQVGVEVAQQSEVVLVVRSSEGHAVLSVQNGELEILVRNVRSSDCLAVAEAFALIAADAISNLSVLPREVIAPESDSVGAIEERATAPQVERNHSSSNLAVGVLLGFGSSDMTAFPGFAQVDLSVDLADYKGRVALWADSSQRFGDQLSRRGFGTRVELGREYVRNRYWIRPAVGGGITLFEITPTDAGQIRQSLIRVHPVAAVSFGIGRQISSSLSLRTDLRGLWYPIADRYISEALPIGESPRTMVSLGVGLEWKVN